MIHISPRWTLFTPKALSTTAQGCRVSSAATLGGDASWCPPGVAKGRQPQAMVLNTFGVLTPLTMLFPDSVQRGYLWVKPLAGTEERAR